MTARTIYDPKNDTLYIRLAEGQIVESEELRPDFIVDYDAKGRIVAVEILSASKNVAENPELVVRQVA
jgi:uncharacterized protein YuzE